MCSNSSPMVRHFGLKILEDVVKARWHNMVPEEKVFIKENLMKLMASGTGHITVEHLYIKVGFLLSLCIIDSDQCQSVVRMLLPELWWS